MLDRYTQANKELWNDWADIHRLALLRRRRLQGRRLRTAAA